MVVLIPTPVVIKVTETRGNIPDGGSCFEEGSSPLENLPGVERSMGDASPGFCLLHNFQWFQWDHTPRTESVRIWRGNETRSGRNALMEAETVFSFGKCHFPPAAEGAQPDLHSSDQVRAERAI